MYLSYYGLYKEPFHITPDPEFLFESPSHKEAFAAIVYGVEKRKGFIAVTGEVGTGKTTVVRAFLKSLDTAHMQPIYVFNPDLTFDDLLRFLLNELGVDPAEKSQTWMLQWLHWTLINHYKDNRGILLVVDEAQNMPVETLEKLRMLSNLETTEEKLLQIVLVGQPELDDKLNLHQLRQLKQRLAVRATLRPLSTAESLEYIRHRFERAGGQFDGIFSPAAIRTLVRLAKGSPRSLNILCDNILLAGFGAEQRPISAGLVREVARDLEGRGNRRRAVPALRWAAAAAAALLLVAAGITVLGNPGGSSLEAGEPAERLNVAHAQAPLAAPAPVEPTPVEPDTPVAPVPAAPVPAAPVPAAPAPAAAPIPTVPPTIDRLSTAPAPVPVASPAPPAPAATPAPVAQPSLDGSVVPAATPSPPATPVPAPVISPAPAAAVPVAGPTAVVAPAAESPEPPPAPRVEAPRVRVKAAPAGPGELEREVQPGENLTRLVMEIYGRCDEKLLRVVQVRNPFVTDVNMILTGQKLVFPKIDGVEPGGASTPGAGS